MLVMQNGSLALDATPAQVMRPEVMQTLFGFEAETVASAGKTWIVPRM